MQRSACFPLLVVCLYVVLTNDFGGYALGIQRIGTVEKLGANGRDAAPSASSNGAPDNTLGFDVVSIRINKVGGGISMSGVGSSFRATNVSLMMLLVNSYGIREDLISGEPGWARTARFDVDAKIVNPDLKQIDALSRDERREMLASILKERFHVQIHRVVKTLSVYDLELTKQGPKFKESTSDTTSGDAAKGGSGVMAGGILVNSGVLTAHAIPVSTLAASLSQELGKTVIDKTGLTAKYDFNLKWTPDEAEAGASQVDPSNSGPSIFTALQEQLGLHLRSGKGPVETLIVDHAEMPSEN